MMRERRNIYLAGPINKCTDLESMGWREEAKQLIGPDWNCVDPMRRDHRGQEFAHAAQIVGCDLFDIDQCGILLANAQRPSWGTAMEIYEAFTSRQVLVVCWIGLEEHPSPWLRMHSHYMAPHLKEAVEFIKLP